MDNPTLSESLAAYAHDAWAGWMCWLFAKSYLNEDGTVTIPASLVERWVRQATTPYADLPEAEKASDRDEADKMLVIIRRAMVFAGLVPESTIDKP
jgi:hypothetical protein